MLKSQINPHFLFNSLNSIASLTMSNPDEAREMIIRLSDFLRYSLKHRENEYVPLKEELGRMKDYLAIEKIRFGEKLQYIFNISSECEEFPVPTMIFQPFLKMRSDTVYTRVLIPSPFVSIVSRKMGL